MNYFRLSHGASQHRRFFIYFLAKPKENYTFVFIYLLLIINDLQQLVVVERDLFIKVQKKTPQGNHALWGHMNSQHSLATPNQH